jgi:glycosyltransferase involved in cell wall biosynthesis
MKLMALGHPFLFAYNQRKFVAMKRLDPELCLRLVVPSRGRERFEFAEAEVHPALSQEEVVRLAAWPAGSHMTHIHHPLRLAALLRNFQPDVIYIDPGEPQALLTAETIMLQRVLARGAAMTLFTVDNLLRPRRFPLNLVKNGLRASLLPRVDAMICCNRRAAELLQTEGRFRGPVVVLPQFGLDVAEHTPGRESRLRFEMGIEGVPVIGYAGRLVAQKGLRQLFAALQALERHPWKLLLVGSGPLETEIRERWMTQLPDRIVLLPAVPYEQVARHLRCVDILVLASYATDSWAEQFGLVLAQAMMLGIPCVGSSSGAIPEVIGPGGLCFAEGETGELTRALESLLKSPARREQLGKAGRSFALAHYTDEKVAEKYLEVFARARKRKARHAGIESASELESVSAARR